MVHGGGPLGGPTLNLGQRLTNSFLWLPRQTDHYVVAPVGGATVSVARHVVPPRIRASRVVRRVWNEVRNPNSPVRLGIDSGVAYGAVTAVTLSVLDAVTPGRLWGSIADFYTKHPVQAGLATAGGLAGIVAAADIAVSTIRHAYANAGTGVKIIYRNITEVALAGILLLSAVGYNLGVSTNRPGGGAAEAQPPAATATPTSIPTATQTLEAVVEGTPTPEAAATPTPYATAAATATSTSTATPTTPTPIAGLAAIMGAQRFGISYELAKEMHSANPEGFYQAFGVVQAAQAQVPNWFDGNASNGEVVPLNGIAVAVDEPAGRARFYLQGNAAAAFKVQVQGPTDFLVNYLRSNPSRVGEVTVITPGQR